MASLPIPAAQLRELETLSGLPQEEYALREAASTLVRLARDPILLDAHVLPLLEGAREVGEWYVARCSADLYGPRTGGLDGRDYYPSRDYVCDRFGG